MPYQCPKFGFIQFSVSKKGRNIDLDHLARFLFQAHAGEHFFHLLFHTGIGWDDARPGLTVASGGEKGSQSQHTDNLVFHDKV